MKCKSCGTEESKEWYECRMCNKTQCSERWCQEDHAHEHLEQWLEENFESILPDVADDIFEEV